MCFQLTILFVLLVTGCSGNHVGGTAAKELISKKEGRHRSLRTATASSPNAADPRCGCQNCTDAVWDLVVSDYAGDFTCGARITWLAANVLQNTSDPHYEACLVVAAQEFPAQCGKACNPLRCDGRQLPYTIEQNEPPILSGDLQVDSDLYCFPSYTTRQRYTNVWNSNFIMEVKETQSPMTVCDPGANYFTTNAVSFDTVTEELTLAFQKDSQGRWTGAEVRLVLPQNNMPFTYGTYEFNVSKVHIINTTTNAVVSQTLPPRLVLGLFTWDSTENFAIRENRNHEVDIEISQFGDTGGPDVNFLVQPPGQPQQATYYSGGGNMYDQSGHVWKFDWNPGNITWYSNAAGGLSHVYSNDIILDYASPPWLQCLPADVEIRINLWSLDGIHAQTNLEDDMKIEVVISNFSYTPSSGDAFVADGGSCTKHCHCAPTSECVAGTCHAVTTAPTVQPSIDPLSVDPRLCASHSVCAGLGLVGTCCPTGDNTFLDCCGTSPSTAVSPPVDGSSSACATHPACAANNLAGQCCPTGDNTMLDCCSTDSTSTTSTTTAVASTTTTTSSTTTSTTMTNNQMNQLCVANPACAHLAGNCCPTNDGTMLYCCFE